MSSRREFILKGTVAMGAMAGASVLRAARIDADDTPVVPLYAAVFDDRLSDSVAFAARARRLGITTSSLERGDVTSLWYHDLFHRWKEGPAAIAGLTTPDALFVLETFGNDAGLRLRFKAEHRIYPTRVEHRVVGPDCMVRRAKPLASRGSDWSSHIGWLVSRTPVTHVARSESSIVTDLGAEPPVGRAMLVSWVLTPRITSSTAI